MMQLAVIMLGSYFRRDSVTAAATDVRGEERRGGEEKRAKERGEQQRERR